MRDWIPADDLAHFVIEAVEFVDVSNFHVNERGTGSAQYEPRMKLALLIYCYAIGIFSSRRIERATWHDLGVRCVAANRHPDHDTIAKFRRENFAAVAACGWTRSGRLGRQGRRSARRWASARTARGRRWLGVAPEPPNSIRYASFYPPARLVQRGPN